MEINSTEELGKLIRTARKLQKLTQADLAAASGAGIRFIVELENGKTTAQIGKTIKVINMLGLKINIGE